MNTIVKFETVVIDNIDDKEEVLEALSNFYDEDFCGNNNLSEQDNFNWTITSELGFSSNQEYVLDKLRKSDLSGEDLISEYLSQWLDSDYYYTEWQYNVVEVNGSYVVTVVALHED